MYNLYCIRTFDKEDKKGTVCKYDYRQFKEVKAMLNENNEIFETWIEKTDL